MFDMLHVLDLGVAAHVVGSCLEECVKYTRQGPNQESRLSAVWARIRELYVAGARGKQAWYFKVVNV